MSSFLKWKRIKISGTLENLTKHNKNHRKKFSQFIFSPPSRDEVFHRATVRTHQIKYIENRVNKKRTRKIIASIYYVTLLSCIDCIALLYTVYCIYIVARLPLINVENEENNQTRWTWNVFIISHSFFYLEELTFTGFTLIITALLVWTEGYFIIPQMI